MSRILAAIAGALTLALAVLAAPAQAATSGPCWGNSGATCRPYMNTSFVPWMTPDAQGAQYRTVSGGTGVDMRCWTTGAYRNGTSKWFWVRSSNYPFTSGYVPATTVSSQIVVGHC
jgi:hypothetical protein